MELKERLKIYEGTKEYQAKFKYFRDGKFYPYADSLGKMTIGYGHLIKQGEDYSNGLTEEEADKLLSKDLANAVLQVQSLGIDVPSDWNDFLILMTFQLGINGVKNFKRMIAALNEKNYREAVLQAQDSKWNAQTPFRVRDMVFHLINK